MQPGRGERQQCDALGAQLGLERDQRCNPDRVAAEDGLEREREVVDQQVRREVARVVVDARMGRELAEVPGNPLRQAGRHERKDEDGLERMLLRGGERVAAAHEEENAVFGHGLDREPRRVAFGARRVGHREFEPAGKHLARELVEVAGLHVNPEPGVGGGHPPECRAQRQFGGEQVRAEVQFGCLQAREFLEVAREVAGLRKDTRGVIEHQPAGRLTGLQRPRGRVDEPGTDARRVERQQAPGEGLGVQPQRPRDLGEVGGGDQRHEVEQARLFSHRAPR